MHYLLILLWILIPFTLLALLWIVATMPRYRPPEALWELTRWRYAHRGYHDDALGLPENSLGAFRRALENGFGAELDVHLTRDGKLAVMHDESLFRLCGLDRKLADLDAAELAPLRLGDTQERVPFLSEVLALFDGRAPLIIELKTHRGNHAALCKAVCRELDDYRGLFCIESFDPRVLYWLRLHRPDLVRGQLSEHFRRHGTKLGLPLRFLLHNLLLNFLTRPDFVAFCCEDRRDLGFRFCRLQHLVREFSWTVRSPKMQRRVEAEGATIIFEGFDPRENA